ncbi:MAG: acyl-CoA dehydrogenase family protein [Actinobacteria bacterium]|nr:acyl-CoA dehydrogenase family protein [Actinomycetota bacterium]
MDFELSAGHLDLRDRARKVAEDSVAPFAAQVDADARYPREAVDAMRRAGLFGAFFPAEVGGAGLGTLGLVLAVEEVAKYCASTGLVLTLSRLATAPFMLGGSDEQRATYGGMAARGEVVCSFALTEPGAGSDVANLSTRAVRDGDGYRIDGVKSWVSQYLEAGFYTIFAKVGDRVCCFIVERDTDGVELSEPTPKMGVRGVATGEIRLNGARVPEANRVGSEGDGFKIAMNGLNSMRPVIGARAIGLAEGVFEYARAYALERQTFGQPIIRHEWVMFTLAEMAMEIDAARLLTYRAAWMADRGEVGKEHAGRLSTSKAFPSEVAERAATNALQILGARGYSMHHPIERAYRDAKQLQIVEGTNQVQRLIMGRAVEAGDFGYGGWHGVPEPKP